MVGFPLVSGQCSQPLKLNDSGKFYHSQRVHIYIHIYITMRELGPKIPYYRRNYGSQFPNGCICGPSGTTNACSYIQQTLVLCPGQLHWLGDLEFRI